MVTGLEPLVLHTRSTIYSCGRTPILSVPPTPPPMLAMLPSTGTPKKLSKMLSKRIIRGNLYTMLWTELQRSAAPHHTQ